MVPRFEAVGSEVDDSLYDHNVILLFQPAETSDEGDSHAVLRIFCAAPV